MGFLPSNARSAESTADHPLLAPMRTRIRISLLGALLPSVLAGQSHPFPLAPDRLRLDSDTIEYVPTGERTPNMTTQDATIRRLERGRGADSDALIETMTFDLIDQNGKVLARSLDSTVVGLSDLLLRRSRLLRMTSEGKVFLEVRSDVRGTALVTVTRAEGKPDSVKRVSLTPATPRPFGLLAHAIRAAELTTLFTARLPVRVPFSGDIRMVDVDSVRLVSEAGRSAWAVHTHTDADTRVTYLVDSLTRDLIASRVEQDKSRMSVTFRSRRYPTGGALAAGAAQSAQIPSSADIARVAGHYNLEGEREVGSELLLKPDGTFQFMLAYGALDEEGAGRWRVADNAVVLQSSGVPRRPSVILQSSSGMARDSIRILVVDTLGRPMGGLGLEASRNNTGRMTAQIPRDGYTLEFKRGMPPTEISIGVDIFEFRVPFALAAPLKARYRFVFDRGDLGRRRFEQQRLEIGDGRVFMTMNNGHRLTYVRH